jgi:hypothetical protein
MRRILIFLACAAIVAVPADAAAGSQAHSSSPGFLVVRNGFSDDGVTGKPVAIVAVQGFVLGHIAQEGAVKIFHFGSGSASLAQVSGVDVSRQAVTYHGVQQGTKFSGSDFRFRAVGGVWRVVVYGAGVSLYAGGNGTVKLHGSVHYPRDDGHYSLDGGPFVSLPRGVVKGVLGQ